MEDGTLLHPSRSMTPIDAMYAQPPRLPQSQVWATHAAIGGYTAWTVLGVDLVATYNLTYADLYPAPNDAGQLLAFRLNDEVLDRIADFDFFFLQKKKKLPSRHFA